MLLRISLAFLLSGCSTYGVFTDSRGYKWRCIYPPASVVETHVVTDGNVYLHCGLEEMARACTRLDLKASRADIYMPDEAPQGWTLEAMLDHEKMHARGCVHDPKGGRA